MNKIEYQASRLDKMIEVIKFTLPLILLFLWMLFRPDQSADLVKLTAAFLAGKGYKAII
jgi:hypothetical protein